ncbi:MAG: glycosyltransferase family 92 protein, partial [Vicinamibacterales bacterium]
SRLIGALRRLRGKPHAERPSKYRSEPGGGSDGTPIVPLDASRHSPCDRYLTIVAIARNEGRYLPEWIEFHRLVGVAHVYLYDNGSDDDTIDVLAPYVASGFVTTIPWASFDAAAHAQRQAYAHAICNFGGRSRWMAFIDVDEFLFPVEGDSVALTLAAYEDLPAVAVPWHIFGSAGHKRPPQGLVVENYLERAPVPSPADSDGSLIQWKSIVDPRRVKAVKVHLFTLDGNVTGAYDEARRWIGEDARQQWVPADGSGLPSRVLRLNHYFVRSEEEFARKLDGCNMRGDLSLRGLQKRRAKRERKARLIERATVRDETILRFSERLRERLGVRTEER